MRRWLPVGLIVVGVALVLYAFLRSSDEDQILDRLAQLAEAVRVEEGPSNPLVRHGHIRQEFAEIFSKEAHASVAEVAERLRGRDALAAAAAQLPSVYRSAHVSFGDVQVQIHQGGISAEAAASATVTGARHGDALRRDERRVKFQLEKIDGEWKIISAIVEPAG
jgi:phosphoribosylformylglycinamidine synthase